jgi:hypothetical protein
MIYDLLRSEDLLEAKHHLEMIDKFLDRQDVNRSAFCKKLAQSLNEWLFLLSNENIFEDKKPEYYIYQTKVSLLYYLASNDLTLGRVREMRQNIKRLITYIDETSIPPSGRFLAVEKEEKILSVLFMKYPYLEIVSANRPLVVLNFNSTNRASNSFCGTDEGVKSSVILMYNMKDNSVIPEYVFLHELGHALQIALTGSADDVPNEFIEFHNSMPYTEKINQGDKDATELFADTFAISVMRNTELSCFDPFHFSDSLNAHFEAFYFNLFDKYRYWRDI